MKVAIIANGNINDEDFHQSILKDVDKIICADGGANMAHKMGIVPDYVIGDMDSIEVLDKLDKRTKVIEDSDQDKTDVELALELAKSLNPEEIIMLGAIGTRVDHTIANILCLTKINSGARVRIVDDKNNIELVDKKIDITGEKDDVISVVPLTDISKLNYEGLKWCVHNEDKDFGWFGICNRLVGKEASINLGSGKVLVINARD